jgi:hypothetical protein
MKTKEKVGCENCDAYRHVGRLQGPRVGQARLTELLHGAEAGEHLVGVALQGTTRRGVGISDGEGFEAGGRPGDQEGHVGAA